MKSKTKTNRRARGNRHANRNYDDSINDGGSSQTKWKGYFKCDDLYPPLCDDTLQVTKGRVETLDGVYVTYWKYYNAPDNEEVVEDDETANEIIVDRVNDVNVETVKHKSIQRSTNEKKRKKHPIIVINGGPGLPHNYITPARSLACDTGREVVLYDQAGTGQSWLDVMDDIEDADPDRIKTLFPELFTIDYYAHVELPAIIRALNWTTYHVLGESWGTQIAFEYAARSHPTKPPRGLQSLLMNAPISDNHKFIQYQWDPVDGTVGTLPTYLQQRLQYYNKTQNFDNDEFEELEDVVMEQFNARIGVTVDCWLDTVDAGISTIDYDTLTGVTDIFYPIDDSVNMKGWTVLPDLWKLSDYDIPVQLNYGRYDMVRPHLIADTAFQLGYPDSTNKKAEDNSFVDKKLIVECHMLDQAAHSILLDAPVEAYGYIQDFVHRVEHPDGTFRAKGSCPVPSGFWSQSWDKSWRSSYSNYHGDRKSNDRRWHYSYNRDNDKNSINNNGRMEFMASTSSYEWILSMIVAIVVSFIIGTWYGMKRSRNIRKSSMSLSPSRQILTQECVDGRDYQSIPNAFIDSSTTEDESDETNT